MTNVGGSRRLLLLRHGLSTWNAEGRWQGWADPPLSEVGRAETVAAAHRLRTADVSFSAVVSSDLTRSRQTALILAAELGLGPVTVEPGLRELEAGEWTGRTRAEIECGWPGLLDAWRDGRLRHPPRGEDRDAFTARVIEAIGRVAAAGTGHVLVVTHGGVIRAVDLYLGAEPAGLGNLAGRWLRWTKTTLEAEEAMPGADPDGHAIPIRR